MIHQHVQFSQDNITLAWGVFDVEGEQKLQTSSSQYTVNISNDCNPNNVSASYSTNNTRINITVAPLLNNRSYINIAFPAYATSIVDQLKIKPGGKFNKTNTLWNQAAQ